MIISSIFDLGFITTFVVSAALFGSWFSFWYKSNLARTEKERAYVCALLSSSVTSLCSIPLVYTLLTNGGNLAEILAYRTWTVVATTFFMTFLVTDLVIGVVFYRNKLEWLTGWIHHITYLCVLTWAIHNQFTAGFIMMCSLEIPTFILALGSVRSQFRRDYMFAGSFLITRILFHAFAIKCAWVMKPFGSVVIALSAFFPLHCFWFYGFVKQQIRLATRGKQQQASSAQRQRSATRRHHIQPSVVSTTTISSETTIKKTCTPKNNTTHNTKSTYLSSSTSSFHQPSPVSVH